MAETANAPEDGEGRLLLLWRQVFPHKIERLASQVLEIDAGVPAGVARGNKQLPFNVADTLVNHSVLVLRILGRVQGPRVGSVVKLQSYVVANHLPHVGVDALKLVQLPARRKAQQEARHIGPARRLYQRPIWGRLGTWKQLKGPARQYCPWPWQVHRSSG